MIDSGPDFHVNRIILEIDQRSDRPKAKADSRIASCLKFSAKSNCQALPGVTTSVSTRHSSPMSHNFQKPRDDTKQVSGLKIEVQHSYQIDRKILKELSAKSLGERQQDGSVCHSRY